MCTWHGAISLETNPVLKDSNDDDVDIVTELKNIFQFDQTGSLYESSEEFHSDPKQSSLAEARFVLPSLEGAEGFLTTHLKAELQRRLRELALTNTLWRETEEVHKKQVTTLEAELETAEIALERCKTDALAKHQENLQLRLELQVQQRELNEININTPPAAGDSLFAQVDAKQEECNDTAEKSKHLVFDCQIMRKRIMELENELHQTRRQLNQQRRESLYDIGQTVQNEGQREEKPIRWTENSRNFQLDRSVQTESNVAKSMDAFVSKDYFDLLESRSWSEQQQFILRSSRGDKSSEESLSGSTCTKCGRAADDFLEPQILEKSELLAKKELENIRLKEIFENTQTESSNTIRSLEKQLLNELRTNRAIQQKQLKKIGKELESEFNRKRRGSALHCSTEVSIMVLARTMSEFSKAIQTDNIAWSCLRTTQTDIHSTPRSRSVQTDAPQFAIANVNYVVYPLQSNELSESQRLQTPTTTSFKTPFPIPLSKPPAITTLRTPIPRTETPTFMRQRTQTNRALSLSTASSPTPRPYTPLSQSPLLQFQTSKLTSRARKPLPRFEVALRDSNRYHRDAFQQRPIYLSSSLGSLPPFALQKRSPSRSHSATTIETRSSKLDEITSSIYSRTSVPLFQFDIPSKTLPAKSQSSVSCQSNNLCSAQLSNLNSRKLQSSNKTPRSKSSITNIQQFKVAPYLSKSFCLPRKSPRSSRFRSSMGRPKSILSSKLKDDWSNDSDDSENLPSRNYDARLQQSNSNLKLFLKDTEITPAGRFLCTESSGKQPSRSKNLLRRAREALKEDPFKSTPAGSCNENLELDMDIPAGTESDDSSDRSVNSQQYFSRILRSGQLLARRSTRY